MNNLLFVDVDQSVKDLEDDCGSVFLGEFLDLLHFVFEVAFGDVFEDDVDEVWVLDLAVEFDDVRVVEGLL